MGQHGDYGRRLLDSVAGDRFTDDWKATLVEYRGGTAAHIDGVISGDCAVEVESRVDKQIRGALVDLLLHPCSKKLLVLIPAWMNQPEKTKLQCEDILGRLKRPSDEVRVVLLKGNGDDRRDDPKYEEDKAHLKSILLDLGVL